MGTNITTLARLLNYKFSEPEHLKVALSHSSLAIPGPKGSNERYEFLGDRVLGLVIAEMLLDKFPNESVGDIARRYAALVSQQTIVRVAEGINLGSFIEMDDGTEGKAGRSSPSILSDCCEAIIAALYIDGGLITAREFIKNHWGPILMETLKPPKDAKTALQEWVLGRGLPLPRYSAIGTEGPAHKPTFVIEVRVADKLTAKASGKSKQKAEQLAAESLIRELKSAEVK